MFICVHPWLRFVFAFASLAGAQTFSTLATFNSTIGFPLNPLALGPDGNYYGTTPDGGPAENGTIFKLTPSGALTTLYDFQQSGLERDGTNPSGPLVLGPDGNFYGVTQNGGTGVYESGTVFKITPSGSFTVLFNFGGTSHDASAPIGGLVLAPDGNYYGLSAYGGSALVGTIFRLTQHGTESLIYSFSSETGAFPMGSLMVGTDGNLYGLFSTGNNSAATAVFFNISTGGNYTPIYKWTNFFPTSNLVAASDGNFYGMAGNNGNGPGSFFKLTTAGALSVIATVPSLGGVGAGGVSLIQGKDGNFYGASAGGTTGKGMIFRMTPAGALTVLYSFCEQSGCPDSSYPKSILQTSDGSLIGTTNSTIFRFTLPPPACTAAAAPTITSIDSASAYGGYAYFASGSWLEIKGTNMVNPSDPRLTAATNPGQWTSSDFTGVNAPTTLDGNSVSINGKPAYVWYISPTQLNVQAPEDSTIGSVSITATNCLGTSLPFPFTKQALAPGLLAPPNYAANGTQYLVATFASDGAYVLDPSLGTSFGLNARPAKPNDVIIAYGVGFGDVTPSIPPGVIVGESNTLINPVTFSFGSTQASLAYWGLAGNFVGLYEFFVTVPAGLAPGDYPIVVTQNGAKIPQTFSLTIGN